MITPPRRHCQESSLSSLDSECTALPLCHTVAALIPRKAFVKLGYTRGHDLRFATYDWRKYGQDCWLTPFFKRLMRLVVETSENNGNRRVVLACHSMGCSLLLNFFNSAPIDVAWKARYVERFLAVAPAISGSTHVLPRFIQGLPLPGLVPGVSLTRQLLTSMPGSMLGVSEGR